MDEAQPTLEQLKRAFKNAQIVIEVATFRLPTDIESRLTEAGQSPLPESSLPQIVRLQLEGGARQDWSARLQRGLANVHEGLAAAHYHADRVRQIEERIVGVVDQLDLERGQTISFPSRLLTFEYQAFVLALRRTLEYLAAATAAFFKLDQPRIRHLADNLGGRAPTEVGSEVAEYVRDVLRQLPRVLSEGEELSVRDRIVHTESVDAGTFNVLLNPASGELEIHLVGGGEEFAFALGPTPLLDETLRLQLDKVVSLVLGVYERLGLSPTRSID
jgi:hypothetical protein